MRPVLKLDPQLIPERKFHSESQRKLEAKYSAEIKSLKSNIKTLKRKLTLAQKASSVLLKLKYMNWKVSWRT